MQWPQNLGYAPMLDVHGMDLPEFDDHPGLDDLSPDTRTECSIPGNIHTGMLVHEFFQKVVGASIPSPQTRDHGVSGLSKLVFTHSCRSTSCSDAFCSLCRNSLLPQCQDEDFFKDRIVRGREPLRAKCNASISINLRDPAGRMVNDENLSLQVIVVDGRAFDQDLGHLQSVGCLTQTHIHDWINGNMRHESPLMDCKLQDVVVTTQGIPIHMKDNSAILPDVYLAEKSKKGHERSSYYRLLCIADVDHGCEIHAAVSPKLKTISTRFWRDPTRSKTTPHETDSVKKLPKIGLERARILEEMNIRTVGDLKKEVEKSAQHKVNVGKRVMGCENADWENVYSTVMSSTAIDNRPRVWQYRNDCGNLNFAVFSSNQAVIDWAGLSGIFLHGHGLIPNKELEHVDICNVQNAALEDWNKPGHPNWDIFESGFGQMQEPQRQSPFLDMSPPADSSFPIATTSKQEIDLWNADVFDGDVGTLGQSLDCMSLADSRSGSLPPQTCRSSMSSLELLRLLNEDNIPCHLTFSPKCSFHCQ